MSEILPNKQVFLTEGREMRDFDVKKCFSAEINFTEFYLDIANGDDLPEGISLGNDGVLRGSPRMGATIGSPYKIVVDVNDEAYQQPIDLHVGAQLRPEDIANRQGQIWRAFHDSDELPMDFVEFVERPISKLDVYHLVERFASFTIWNADDRSIAGEGRQIRIRESNDKFLIYDFEVCIVATPKDLFAGDRTLGDAVDTGRAMVREAHRRRWHVEFGGFDKMATQAWHEVQKLNNRSRHKMEIKNYTPTGVDAAPTQGLEEQHEPE